MSDAINVYRWKLDGTRPMIHYIAEHQHPKVGVELGIQAGINAENILNNLSSLRTLYLVDCYPKYRDGNSQNGAWFDYSPDKAEMLRRMAQFGKRVVFIEADTLDASSQIPDELDFVYIDDNHCYEHLKAELALYYPKVKSGGIIGGHDINFYGVMRAVGEFAEGINVHPWTDDKDWFIHKP